MNIFDYDNEIYGTKKLKQGEYVDFKMKSVEQQELLNIDIDSCNNIDSNSYFSKINKEIKF